MSRFLVPLQCPRSLPLRLCRCLVMATGLFVVGCTTVQHEVPRPPSTAIENPQETLLGSAFAAQLASTPGLSGFRLLPSGQEAFLVRAALAEAAQLTLDLQYHIIAADATGTLLMYRALRAAERGVRVRLLIDDLDVGDRDSDLATLAAHPNVQVRVFNPFPRRGLGGSLKVLDYLSDGAHLNRRMHNKLWIADNAAALIGGRNLGDAYFNADGQTNFADLDVLAVGPVVVEASRSFDEYWNSEWSVPIEAFTEPAVGKGQVEQLVSAMSAQAAVFRDSAYAQALRATDLGQLVRSGRLALVPAYATMIYDRPDKLQAQTIQQSGHVVSNLRDAIAASRTELVMISPYFVPTDRGVGALCELVQRGVRVRVLTNSLASTDVAAVHAGYARYRPRLLACGVSLSELRPSVTGSGTLQRVLSSGVSLHAKAIMLDGKAVLIGSMNLDPRSRLSNTEVAVLIDSAVLGRQLGLWLDEATAPDRSFAPQLTEPGNPASPVIWHGLEDGQPVRYTDEPLASAWQQIAAGLLGVLIPEELL